MTFHILSPHGYHAEMAQHNLNTLLPTASDPDWVGVILLLWSGTQILVWWQEGSSLSFRQDKSQTKQRENGNTQVQQMCLHVPKQHRQQLDLAD